MSKITYKLSRHPGEDNIFVCTMKDIYDLSMTFMRVQEYYESPFKQIRGKHFNFLEFMKLYSLKFGDGAFTYPSDWAGFNVPGKCVVELYKTIYDDYNVYDSVMTKIAIEIEREISGKRNISLNKSEDVGNYYLIGMQEGDQGALDHELCHAKFALNKKYKKKALENLKKVPVPILKKIEKYLLSIGYCKKTLKDEFQAYIAVDYNFLVDCIKFTKKEEKKLKEIHLIMNEEFKK